MESVVKTVPGSMFQVPSWECEWKSGEDPWGGYKTLNQ